LGLNTEVVPGTSSPEIANTSVLLANAEVIETAQPSAAR
jgi:hypothetical protein